MHDSMIIIIFSTNTVTPTFHREYYCLTTLKTSERVASFKMHNYDNKSLLLINDYKMPFTSFKNYSLDG